MVRQIKLWEWCVGVAIIAFLAGIVFPVSACACSRASTTQCLSNVKRQSSALLLYAADWNERLPDRDLWMDSATPFVKAKNIFVDPNIKEEGPFGYSFNSQLSLQPTNGFLNPARQTMIFDSTNLGRNASDPYTSLPVPGRHYGKNNVAYLDGHARSIRK